MTNMILFLDNDLNGIRRPCHIKHIFSLILFALRFLFFEKNQISFVATNIKHIITKKNCFSLLETKMQVFMVLSIKNHDLAWIIWRFFVSHSEWYQCRAIFNCLLWICSLPFNVIPPQETDLLDYYWNVDKIMRRKT